MSWTWIPTAALAGGAMLFLLLAVVVRREALRGTCVVLAVVLLSLTAFEVFLRIDKGGPGFDRTYAAGYWKPKKDDPLGTSRPAPGRHRVVSVTPGDHRPIYDVVYTVGADGLRVTPGGGPGADTYLFFGGSFLYGEGVQDDETLPARFSAALGHRFTAVNAALHGYGPHHMLRILDRNLLGAAVTGKVRRAFFLMIDTHANRAVGMYGFNTRSPRYVLDPNGRLRDGGLFSDHLLWRVLGVMHKVGGTAELVGRALWTVLVPPPERLRITTAIMVRSAELLRETYGASLTCLLVYDDPEMESHLRAAGLEVLRVSDLVGDARAPEMQIMHRVEVHPSPLFHERLGSALAGLVDAGRL